MTAIDYFADPRVKEAESLANDAEDANVAAGRLYEAVAREVPAATHPNTRSDIAVAAVVCYARAAKWERALRLARYFLTRPALTLRGRAELTAIIERSPVAEPVYLEDIAENQVRSAVEGIIAERDAYRERWRASTPSNPSPTVHALLLHPEFIARTALIRYAPTGGALDKHDAATHVLVGIDAAYGTYLEWTVRYASMVRPPGEFWEQPETWRLNRHILDYPAELVPSASFRPLAIERSR